MPIVGGQEGDRVTTLELFFDLVYAFAFTQVTVLMGRGSAPGSLIDGYIVLSLLWFSWCAFSWLANQAHADEGILRGVFVVAMTAAFLLSLAIPDAFRDVPGAVTVVACYAVVRLTHASAYLLAARKDRGLHRQIVVTLVVSLLPTLALLSAGAAAARPAQRWLWLAAVLYDFALLLALGLWSAYFARTLPALEEPLAAVGRRVRSRLGQVVFTFLHFVVIAGIIVTAFGVRIAMARLGAGRIGVVGGWSLGVGPALFLTGTIAAIRRANGQWLTTRIPAIAVLLVLSPLISGAPSVVAVAAVAVVVLCLGIAESLRSRASRSRTVTSDVPG